MNRMGPGQERSARAKSTKLEASFLSVQEVTFGTGRCRLGTIFVTQ